MTPPRKTWRESIAAWSQHRHATRYLGALSFSEAFFFPIPPEVMLLPMALATPNRARHLAIWTTACSVAGGIVGFMLGALAIEALLPLIEQTGHAEHYARAVDLCQNWGVLAVFIAAVSPIPYKIFAIAAGAMSMLFPAFVLSSLVGRGLRFLIMAALASNIGLRSIFANAGSRPS